MPDFAVQNHGSIVLLEPLTDEAIDWCNEHLPEDATRWGRDSYVVEPRYVGAIVDGFTEDGLTL
jgi:hypothetical protein